MIDNSLVNIVKSDLNDQKNFLNEHGDMFLMPPQLEGALTKSLNFEINEITGYSCEREH